MLPGIRKINATLSESVLGTVYGLKIARQAWTAFAARMASHSRNHVTHLKRQLQNLKQGSKSCLEYIQEVKHMADQLSAVGKLVDDDDLISYIVSGLNSSFTPFVTSYSFATRDSILSLHKFQDELMNYETLLEHHNQSMISDTATLLCLQINLVNFFPIATTTTTKRVMVPFLPKDQTLNPMVHNSISPLY